MILLLPVMFFAAVVVITGMQCCSSAADDTPTAAADSRPSDNDIAKASRPELIGTYSVPLHCPLVKGLGCGSESKSVMTRLERQPAVEGAWLNHAGTRLAILWKDDGEVNDRAGRITSAFENSAVPIMLSGEERDVVLRDFLSGTGWYRTSALDELSAQEADIVAKRWVAKITRIIPLPAKVQDALHCRLSEKMRRRFVEN